MSKVIEVTDEVFDRSVLESKIPVLVDFWAPWCGPCKMIAPVLEEVSEERADQLVVAKLNVDGNSQVAARYGVRSIPSLMLFKDGQLLADHVGALSKTQLLSFLDEHL